MSGVYGGFITCFPELFETLTFWSDAEGLNTRSVRGIYSPSHGLGATRLRLARKGFSNDIEGEDKVLLSYKYKDAFKIGDFFSREKSKRVYRVTGETEYRKGADFIELVVQPVAGPDKNDTSELKVKEGYFA